MKTPIQELIDAFQEIQKDQDPFSIHEAIELAESMLEKEKEVIMDAYEAGSHTEWNEDTWMLLEKQEYYNETFNTKER